MRLFMRTEARRSRTTPKLPYHYSRGCGSAGKHRSDKHTVRRLGLFHSLPCARTASFSSYAAVSRGDGVTFTLIHSTKTMAAQDFNFLLATDSYKVSEFGLMDIF